MPYGNARTAGVSIRVIKVLNPNPNTIDIAKLDHQSTILLPIKISLPIKSTLTPIAKGNKPNIVVKEVKRIGLNLCLHALTIRFDFLR